MIVSSVLVVLASMATLASIGILIRGEILVGLILLIWNITTVVYLAMKIYKGSK